MRHAIEKSCNVYFYTLGNMLGVDRIYKWAEKLGLAGKTGIDLPNEQASLVPNTEWKLKRTGERWYPGETISVAIGQGQVTVTPASLANMIATVANGGTRVTPHVREGRSTRGRGGSRCRWRPWPTRWRSGRRRWRRCTMACGWSSTPAGTGRPRAHRRARRRRQDGHGAGDFQRGPGAREEHRARPARSRLVRVLRAEGQPADRRGHLRRARPARTISARRSRST